MPPVQSRIAVAVVSILPLTALADTKPPQAQYWVDVATNNSSIPGMPGGLGGMVGSMMGVGGGPQKSLDLWLYSRNAKPASPEATHDIPPALNMGPTLPLVLPRVEKASPSEDGTPGKMEKPKARMLFYWGCGESVRPGQPKVADTEKMSLVQFGQAMKGRSAPDRGPWGPGRAVWPNEKNTQQVPAASSLQGDHFVHGNYAPDIKFRIGQQQDFMDPVQLAAQGAPAESVKLEWQTIPTATGYFLMAHRTSAGERRDDHLDLERGAGLRLRSHDLSAERLRAQADRREGDPAAERSQLRNPEGHLRGRGRYDGAHDRVR